MTWIAALLVGIAAALVVYSILPRRDYRAAARQIAGIRDDSVAPVRVRARTLVRHVFPQLSRWLYWAQIQGNFRGWSEETVVLAQATMGLAGLGLALLLQLPPLFAAALVGFSSVFIANRLHSGFQSAQRRVEQELPLVAMALATTSERGVPIPVALRHLAALEGKQTLAPRWLTHVLASCPAAVPVLEWMQEQARRAGIPALVGFAGTLRTIEERGKGHEELYTLAAQVTGAYLAGVQRRVKQLDDRLSLAVGAFFFLPYVALIAVPVLFGFSAR